MRGRSYDNPKPEQQQPRKTNSHFISLQCVLDKYQHQNHMLSQKVASLMSQNNRLKQMKPMSDYLNTSSRILQSRYHGEEYNGKNIELLSEINKKIQRSFNYSNPKKTTTYNKTSLTLPRERSMELFQPLDYRKQGIKKQFQDEAKTQRKYSYIQKYQQSKDTYPQLRHQYPKITSQNKYNTSIQKKSLESNGKLKKNFYQNSLQQQSSNRNLQTERTSHNFRQRAKTQLYSDDFSPRKNSQQIKNKFNRNVYLQKQTFLQQGEQDKIPTFIQASFGYKQPRQLETNPQIKNTLSKLAILNGIPVNTINNVNSINGINGVNGVNGINGVNSVNKIIQSKLNISQKKQKYETIIKCFKLGKRQEQNKQNYEIKIQKKQKIQPLSIYKQEKQKYESKLSKKNNSPYINSDYKLSEPKTQLVKIYLPQKTKIKEKHQKIDVRPVVLEENRSIFSINESTDNSQSKKQLIIKQPKQFSLTTETNQRVTDNTHSKSRKNSIWGKKKFIDVMSRCPKKSIFLK